MSVMHISEVIQELGNPVVFYPKLAKVFGIEETIFLCQMLYWSGRGSSEDGYIYKTSDEIEEETALSYKQQLRIRTKLKALGVLLEYQKKLEHKTFYKVDHNVLNSLYLAKSLPSSQREVRTNTESNSGALPKVNPYYNSTKNTTEITTYNTAAKAAVVTIFILNEKHTMKKVNRSTLLREQRQEKTKGDKSKVMYRLAYHYLEVAGIEPTCYVCDGKGVKLNDMVCQKCNGTGAYYDATKLARGLSQVYQESNKNEEEAKRRITVAGEYFNSKGLSWTPIAVWRDWELITAWQKKDQNYLDLNK